MNVDQIIDQLGTPSEAVLTCGDLTWKFRMPTSYQAMKAEEKQERDFVKRLTERGSDTKPGPTFPDVIREIIPHDIDDVGAKAVYLLHCRCTQSPTQIEGESPITLPDAIKLLQAPRFVDLAVKTVEAYQFRETARLLEAEVEREKNA